jgi:hypothetical protein
MDRARAWSLIQTVITRPDPILFDPGLSIPWFWPAFPRVKIRTLSRPNTPGPARMGPSKFYLEATAGTIHVKLNTIGIFFSFVRFTFFFLGKLLNFFLFFIMPMVIFFQGSPFLPAFAVRTG